MQQRGKYNCRRKKREDAATKRLLAYYRKLRKEMHVSRKALEEITGIGRPTINRYENGKLMPSVRALSQLLEPLGYRLEIVPIEKDDGVEEQPGRRRRMKKALICSLACLAGCAALAFFMFVQVLVLMQTENNLEL